MMCSGLLPARGAFSSVAVVGAGSGILRILRTTAPVRSSRSGLQDVEQRIEPLGRTCDTGDPVYTVVRVQLSPTIAGDNR
jgi:hypothetical protein